MGSPVTDYLCELERTMRAQGLFEAETLAEIDCHLYDSVEANLRLGLGQVEAEEEALRSFGSVRLIAARFEHERRRPEQEILLVLAIVAGLSIAYIDSRPNWDDTGISVGLVLLTAGLFALLGYRRPWLLAITVGGWIPLYGSLVTHRPASTAALIIALVGAYTGRVCRAAIVRAWRLS
jgi:hypothetical protein